MTNNTLPLFTPSESVPIAAQLQITTTQVTDENRVSFWPQHFGNIPQWIILEPTVFAWMDRFCADYSGGIWNFIRSATAARLWLLNRRTMNRGRCSTR